jgi:hypothetical protein
LDTRPLPGQGRPITLGCRLEPPIRRKQPRKWLPVLEIRAEQKSLAEVVGKVANAVIAIVARQVHHTEVLTRHSELLDKLYKIQQTTALV